MAETAPRPIVICSHQPGWTDQFQSYAQRIRTIVGSAVTRIDHIGSTAVPGLAAKDIIDVQVTVTDLDEASNLTSLLRAYGFREGLTFQYDVFHSMPETDPELRKLYMREPEGERRAHIHVREVGRFNQRYALLVRDYLRSSELVRHEYEMLKRRAAEVFPNDIDGYMYLKEPVLHIIYEGALLWADRVQWMPGEDFV
jgi:GrpB-like predicted nucleotidyltransferase (UPF0157 family)